MPNRIIKESIRSSDTIASLTDFEFRLWVNLIVSVDDAGRGDARPAIIKGSAFPLRERVTVKDIKDALHGLAAKGCVSLYKVDGKPYFWFPSWTEHQRIRDSKPKYPAPPENAEFDDSCGNSPQLAASCGNPPPETESESKSESSTNIPPKSPQGGVLDELSPELREAVEGFIEYRKKIKKPMTDRAIELLIGKLRKMAATDAERIEMLNQSVMNGWQGVFELKGETKKTGTNNVFLAMMQEEGF